MPDRDRPRRRRVRVVRGRPTWGADPASLAAAVDAACTLIEGTAADSDVGPATLRRRRVLGGRALALAIGAELGRRGAGVARPPAAGRVHPRVVDADFRWTLVAARSVLVQHPADDDVVPAFMGKDLAEALARLPRSVRCASTSSASGHVMSAEMLAGAQRWLGRCREGSLLWRSCRDRPRLRTRRVPDGCGDRRDGAHLEACGVDGAFVTDHPGASLTIAGWRTAATTRSSRPSRRCSPPRRRRPCGSSRTSTCSLTATRCSRRRASPPSTCCRAAASPSAWPPATCDRSSTCWCRLSTTAATGSTKRSTSSTRRWSGELGGGVRSGLVGVGQHDPAAAASAAPPADLVRRQLPVRDAAGRHPGRRLGAVPGAGRPVQSGAHGGDLDRSRTWRRGLAMLDELCEQIHGRAAAADDRLAVSRSTRSLALADELAETRGARRRLDLTRPGSLGPRLARPAPNGWRRSSRSAAR